MIRHINSDGRWYEFSAWRHRTNQGYFMVFGHVFMLRVGYEGPLYQVVKRLPLGE